MKDLNNAQAQLDEKQKELDAVQAEYDKAMRDKQVSRLLILLLETCSDGMTLTASSMLSVTSDMIRISGWFSSMLRAIRLRTTIRSKDQRSTRDVCYFGLKLNIPQINFFFHLYINLLLNGVINTFLLPILITLIQEPNLLNFFSRH